MSYPRYSAYKDSGIPWVGDVPKDWEVNPVLAFANERKVKNTLGEETNVLSLSYGNIIQRDVESNFGLLPESFNTYQIVKKGNIILRLTDLQNDKKSLRVGLAKENGIITSAYLNLDFQKKVIPEYAYYLLHSYDLAKVFYSLGGGVRQSLGYDELRRVSFICPSPEEQENIVNFLKTETSKTDTLIKKNEKLISLLQEKRQAMISHAVTKGINPDAPMKDSGIEWLGEIPAHWKMKRLKYLGVAKNGLTYAPEDITDENGTLVLRSSNVQNQRIVLDDNVYVDKKIPDRLVTRKNDILICSRNGSRALIGKNALIDEKSAGHTYGAFMMVFRGNINPYLFWVLNSTLFDYQSGTFLTSTINQLTVGNINSFEVPVPPKEEREGIIQHLGSNTSKVNELIDKTKRQNEKLKEHRSALISAAVTGKIDVREWNKKEKAA